MSRQARLEVGIAEALKRREMEKDARHKVRRFINIARASRHVISGMKR
jgi:hypothetical protein